MPEIRGISISKLHFVHFHASGLGSEAPGYWRGSFYMDKLGVAGNSRAGKLKDVLVALNVPYKLNGNSVSFPDIKGHDAECDWQTVDVKGKKDLRIQGVYAVGQRQQSV